MIFFPKQLFEMKSVASMISCLEESYLKKIHFNKDISRFLNYTKKDFDTDINTVF